MNLRRIEPKKVERFEDLARERWAHEPVLGKDAWYACVWYSLWRLISIHFLTPAGVWAITATVLGYRLAVKAFETGAPSDSLRWLLYGFGVHAVFAWLWLCAREEARGILKALRSRIEERKNAPTSEVRQ